MKDALGPATLKCSCGTTAPKEGRRGLIPQPRLGLNCQTRYGVETPAAMGRYDQYVLGSQLFTMRATGRRQPWWLNESLKKCDDVMMEETLLLFHVFCSTISVETNHRQSRHSSSTCVGLVGCFTPNVETRRSQLSTGLSQTCLLPIRLIYLLLFLTVF
jgi:hypothetical protein